MFTEVDCSDPEAGCVQLWTFWECLYFTYISSSSIGLGDYAPETHAGKIVFIFFILISMGLFLAGMAEWDEYVDLEVEKRQGVFENPEE